MIKRILSVAISTAILFALKGYSSNLIDNAGFENGGSSWNLGWNAAIETSSDNVFTGSQSVRVGTANGSGSAEQVITGLTPNTRYTLSGFVKTDDAFASVNVGVKNHGAAEQAISSSSTRFEKRQLNFTTGASTTATVYVYKSQGGGYAYGDDLDITPFSEQVRSQNLVRNEGFEYDLAAWNMDWFASRTDDAADTFEGDYAVKVGQQSGPGAAEAVVAVEPNTDYVLRALAKTDNSAINVNIGVKNHGGSEQFVATSATNYRQLEVEFTTGSNTTAATIYAYKPSGEGFTFADNFELIPRRPELVSNGGAESGSSAWNISWFAAINSDLAHTVSGSQSLAVGSASGAGSAEQTLTGLKPFTKYRLSGFIKVADEGAEVRLGVKNHGASSQFVATSQTQFVSGELEFVTGNTTSATIFVYKPSGNGLAYGDNIRVSETVNQCSSNGNTTFYVDADGGNDGNAGTSPNNAWQSLAKVNSCVFAAGDKLLFDAGDTWIGTLQPKGSGEENNLFVVGKYGASSDSEKPIINGNGAIRAVYMRNQEYVEIRDLEVINAANPDGKKRGIEVENVDAGTLRGIYITNNYVHDVDGDNTKDTDGSAGIMVTTRRGQLPVRSNYDGIFIDGNAVVRVDRTGINTSSTWWCRPSAGCNGAQTYTPSYHVSITNNYVEDAGGDAIVPINSYQGVIEYNLVNGAAINSGTPNAGIWAWNGDENLFQFNEAFNVQGTLDGQGFDIDYGQDSTVFQYNYSHDNVGGAFLIATSPSGQTTNGIIRYNVSQNDGARVFEVLGPANGNKIYNNSVYLPVGSSTKPINIGSWGGYPSNLEFYNNIFHLDGAGDWTGLGNIGGQFIFQNNIVYGVHTVGEPAGAIDQDPMFVSPGAATSGEYHSGQISFGNIDAYMLQAGSPAIGAGLIMDEVPSTDYWGNPISTTAAPNIGAYNGTGE